MAKSSANSPLDGLLDLACRDGVEIRPTLLRVLTDLYVQKPSHSAEEEAQYVELALRLIDAVDGATRSAVAARLSSYANAPVAVLRRLVELAAAPAATSAPQPCRRKTGDPAARPDGRILRRQCRRPLSDPHQSRRRGEPLPRRPAAALSEVIRRLETAALQRNPGEFARMLERALGIGIAIADSVTRDNSGEPLLVAAKALGMPASVFQRILMFINPAVGQSVDARVRTVAALRRDRAGGRRAHGGDLARRRGCSRRSRMRRSMPTMRSDARAAATPTQRRQAASHRASSATPARRS